MGKCKHGGPLLHHHFNLHWKTEFFYLTYGRRVLRWYQWWELNENHWKRKFLLHVYLSPYFTSNPAEGRGKAHLKKKKEKIQFSHEGIYDTVTQGRIPKSQVNHYCSKRRYEAISFSADTVQSWQGPRRWNPRFLISLNYHLKASK